MLDLINRFERIVYMLLIALLVIVLVFALGEMFWYLWISVSDAPMGLLTNHELTGVLGTFLLVLIAVELLDTMKAYIEENVIHVEIVVLLAIIAIARKVILLDPAETDGIELIGIGIIIIGLAASYYLLRKAGFTLGTPKTKEPAEKEAAVPEKSG